MERPRYFSPRSGMKKRRVEKSKYWKHFELLINKEKVKCGLCGDLLAYNSSTSGMKRHLSARHPTQYQELKKEKQCTLEQSRQSFGHTSLS
jgi:hypothetical protein